MSKKLGGQEPIRIDIHDPNDLKGTLQHVGGSRSDAWNNIIINQAVRALWIKHSDEEALGDQRKATVLGLAGIGPKDELEGMIAAQLLAAHNASMECYRRAMLGEQTFEGRRENLAKRTSSPAPTPCCSTRSIATAAKASRRSRSSTSTFTPAARQWSGRSSTGGRGSSEIRGSTPCKADCPCTSAHDVERGRGAGARAGRPRCRTAAAGCTADHLRALRGVIRTPYKHGRYTAEAIARRRSISMLIRAARGQCSQV